MTEKKKLNIMDILAKMTVIIEALKTIFRLFKKKDDTDGER